jgi:competence protein ComEC
MDGRSPSIWWVLAVYSAIAVWLYKPAWISWKHGFKGAALLLVIWWLIPPRWVRVESDTLRAWVLAVGDGAGVVLELPHDRVVVCDFGTRSGFDVGPVGVSFLKHRGIRKLDAVYVSHANFDHFSGIEALARDFDIGKVVINGHFEQFAPEKSAAGRFLQAIRRAGIPIEVINGPRVLDRDDDATIEMLWPPSLQDAPALDANNASTVLRVLCQGRAIILPGDVGDVATGRLLAEADLRADGLLLPHHGSVSGNTARLIDRSDPRVAVRSSGQRQVATTSGIEALVKGRAWFNTADVGCVLLEVKDGKLSAKAVMPD